MVKWHASLRERLIRTGQSNAQYDQKWGYFKPSQRYNVDQSPLLLSYECRKTYESRQADKRVWVSQSNANSGKRFCTINICFRSEGDQPRVSNIFRGQGLSLIFKQTFGQIHLFLLNG